MVRACYACGMATTHYRFGPFLLDPQARELQREGRRIDLPLSTIDCLIHLIRNRDRQTVCGLLTKIGAVSSGGWIR